MQPPRIIDQASLDEAKGMIFGNSIQLITAPKWDAAAEKWTALANVEGCLALVELKVTIPPISDAEIEDAISDLKECN